MLSAVCQDAIEREGQTHLETGGTAVISLLLPFWLYAHVSDASDLCSSLVLSLFVASLSILSERRSVYCSSFLCYATVSSKKYQKYRSNICLVVLYTYKSVQKLFCIAEASLKRFYCHLEA